MGMLFILQGAPGCGKSTFISDHNLEKYVVSPDAIRAMIITDGTEVYDENRGAMVHGCDFSPNVSVMALSMAERMASERMHRDETIIIDSVAAKRRNIAGIVRNAHRNAYDIHYVDMQEGLSLEDVLARNAGRGLRAVPADVVETMYRRCRDYDLQKGEDRISRDDMLAMMRIPELDFDGYRRVRVVGDVQGCFGRLKEAGIVGLEHDPETAVIFSGDLFDRGPDDEAGPLFDWLGDAVHADNMHFVLGNHDNHIRYYAMDGMGRYGKATKTTISRILNDSSMVAHSTKRLERLSRGIYRSMTPLLAFRYHDRHYVVTHGGLHPSIIDSAMDDGGVPGMAGACATTGRTYRLGFISGQECWYGTGSFVGRGDYSMDIDTIIEHDRTPMSPIQIHGHRNTHMHAPYEFKHTFNLETRVEREDGSLSVLELDGADPAYIHSYDGKTYRNGVLEHA